MQILKNGCNVARRRNAADENGRLYFLYAEVLLDLYQGVHRGEN